MKKSPAYMLVLTAGLILIASLIMALASCEKDPEIKSEPTAKYSAEVVTQWMSMQVRQMKEHPATIANVAYSRQYAYTGIALYESVVQGMPSFQSIAPQLNGLGKMPVPTPNVLYHWPTAANAALAYMNRKMFPSASADNLTAINNLEASFLATFQKEADAATIQRSVEFGTAVAKAVFDWADTDGHQKTNDPYTQPADKKGGVYWTAPSPLSVNSAPYFGNVRRAVANSGNGAELPAPDYTKLSEWTTAVIDAKPAATTDEYQMAFWWRDLPGTTSPGHLINMLRLALQKKQSKLDEAAFAYALGGICTMDAGISCWKDKYNYLLARPFDYDDVIAKPFTPLIGGPHPEYPSGHASLSMANAEAMTTIFGDNFSFTDSTFHGLVVPQNVTLTARSYPSFRKAAEDAGKSRFYGGIHYMPTIELSYGQGKKVADNIKASVKFRK